MSRFAHMLKWLLAGVLVWAIGWVVMVHRQSGPGLGPSAVMAVEEAARPPAAVEATSIRTPEVDYAAVLEHDPFGGTQGAGAPGREPALQAAGDSLGVVLVGTVSANAPLARAVLQDAKTKATTVRRIGDRVGEATLESVSRDAAVFVVRGRRLVLKRSTGGPGSASAETSGHRPEASRPSPSAVAQGQPAPARPGRGDIQEFLDKATATPARTESGVKGLRITGLDQIPAARQLGLEEGDVICAVNGQDLADPRKAFQVFRKVRSQDSVEIQLVRKGQNKTLSLDLR